MNAGIAIRSLLLGFLSWVFVGASLAQEWNQFRGPGGSGVSGSTNLPVKFGPNNNVYLVSEAGKVSVVKAAGEWSVLQVNKLDEQCYATPAIADDRIYIRTRSALYCFAKH